jgi:hypothetical protein
MIEPQHNEHMTGSDAFTTQHQAELAAILQSEQQPTAENAISEERRPFRGGEVIRLTPQVVRLDESTGEPVVPLLFVQGMGSEDKLPVQMRALIEHEQREMIGLQYQGRFQGDARLVNIEGLDGAVPEIDALQTDDILKILDELAVERVDGVFVSRGATRGVAAAALRPNTFGRIAIIHGAGFNGQGYGSTHAGALREGAHILADRLKGHYPAGEKIPRSERLGGGLLNLRLEQRSVAYADNIANLQQARQANPAISATIVAD